MTTMTMMSVLLFFACGSATVQIPGSDQVPAPLLGDHANGPADIWASAGTVLAGLGG